MTRQGDFLRGAGVLALILGLGATVARTATQIGRSVVILAGMRERSFMATRFRVSRQTRCGVPRADPADRR